MKRHSTFRTASWLFLSLILLQIFVARLAFGQKSYKELTYPKLKNIKIPQPEIVTLKDGMKLLLIEDHDFPFINISVRIKIGDIYDPPEKAGLATIATTVMRTGGTPSVPGDELDERLENIAAYIETWVNTDMGGANMNTIKDHFDEVLALFADVLMHPAFPDEKIELAKVEMRSAISRRNDDPNQILNREFKRLIYGQDSPYARNIEYATVDAIQREDLVEFHQKYFHPNAVILGIWGDFKTKEMVKKIEAVFRNWKAEEVTYPQVPAVEYAFRNTVNLIKKEDINQSKIRIGHIGGYLNDPDYPALLMMNQVLSGGLASRLFIRVRSNQGLAYDPYGRYGADFLYPGIFFMNVSTKSETTVRAIRALLKELEDITENPVTQDELNLAKDSYLNSWVFKFDSKEKIINRLLTYAYYGYPMNFMETLKERIEGVTPDDILQAARKKLDPKNVQILVVGNPDDFDEPLSVLGNVNEIDITIPVPETEATPAVTAESAARGKELLLKLAKALGGIENAKTIQNYVAEITQTQQTPMGEMALETEVVMEFPDRLHLSMQTPGGQIQMVLAGQESWMVTPQGAMPAPPQVKKNLKENAIRDWVNILKHLHEAEAQFLGETVFQEKPALDVLLSLADVKFHVFVDKETFLPLGMKYSTVGQQGPAEVEEVYSDWRNVGPLKINFKTVSSANGEKVSEAVIKQIQFNQKVDESLFQQ